MDLRFFVIFIIATLLAILWVIFDLRRAEEEKIIKKTKVGANIFVVLVITYIGIVLLALLLLQFERSEANYTIIIILITIDTIIGTICIADLFRLLTLLIYSRLKFRHPKNSR